MRVSGEGKRPPRRGGGFGAFPGDLEAQAPPALKNHPGARKTSLAGTRTDFPGPPDGDNTPNGSGGAGPGRTTGISRDIASPLLPAHAGSPKFYSKQRASPPNAGKNHGQSSHQLPPRLISQRLFRFAFSKALSAPGAPAAAGPREPGAGVRGSSPPRQQLPRTVQYKHTLPPPRPIPTDMEKYKNPKTSAII